MDGNTNNQQKKVPDGVIPQGQQKLPPKAPPTNGGSTGDVKSSDQNTEPSQKSV
ncbi:hypothetical protein 15D039_00155 [Fowlpox virus]|uniref:Uncharacterized protein n=1 Tax=Fowlpox virus TaxID=10261 RepID=A0A891LXU9_FOWPV|nr:hypothetical protein [Fowlpox virus]UNS14372.1 ALPV-208 [Albatrosspox virus]WPD90863.1 hypothetical protein PPV_Vac110-(155-156)n1 [Avipoxvirus sp.]UQT20451.1 hypothetical protein [Fowlpox virus]UQT20695.1 hypothetical protein [Fowlpox virus]